MNESIQNQPVETNKSKYNPTKNKYGAIDIEKALVLYAKGMTYTEIAKYFDVTRQSVFYKLQRVVKFLGNPDELKAFRNNEAEIVDSIRLKALLKLDKIVDRPVSKGDDERSLSVAYGVLVDKTRLMRNQSTLNINQLTTIIEKAHSLPSTPSPKPEHPSLTPVPEDDIETDNVDKLSSD